jgi:hypothetical protein
VGGKRDVCERKEDAETPNVVIEWKEETELPNDEQNRSKM